MSRHLVVLIALLVFFPGIARGEMGGEFDALEAFVARHPSDAPARHKLAATYAASGFVEEATEQYVALLTLDADDARARSDLDELVSRQRPRWLPEAASRVAPFPLRTVKLTVPGREDYAFLITTAGFAAGEGERQDRTHEWRFPRIAYGYVLDPRSRRWHMKVRAHSSEAGAEAAQAALKMTLALFGTVRATLGFDPTRKAQVVDLWVCEEGPPGARTVGSSIYLYAVKTERAPGEWVRELAHEYGHLALPGLGGFTKTDDPWADGDLGELLFVKWLASAKADWLPWSVPEAERAAAVQRAALLGKVTKPEGKLLDGRDEKAREHLLGLALRVEEKAGPGVLAKVLNRCPRGNARQFVAEAEKVGRARGITMWQGRSVK